MSRIPAGTDLALGLASLAGKAGVAATRATLGAAALAGRAPVVGRPVRAATDRVEDEGRRVRASLAAGAESALASAELERALRDVLESPAVLALTDRVLESAEVQRMIDRIARSPELRSAIAEQSAGVGREVLDGVRQRSETLDDVAERAVHRWLRRPVRPSP